MTAMEKLRLIRVRWRTLAGAGLFFALGLAQTVEVIDLRAILSYFISDEKQLGAVLAALPLFFAVMRFVSTQPVITRLRPDEAGKGVDDQH